MAPTTTRKSASAAARELMATKIKSVEDLAGALEDWRTARSAIDEAVTTAETRATDARTAHEEARANGWTVAELRNLGLEPPAQPRRRRGSGNGGGDGGDAASADADGVAAAP